ncbi:HAD family hydrolase [Streptomyces sp. NPDC093225]|uniref:HAD family hydrolase n=1 Tax=Streptomyces sp. NPDC093225 TaxID=3366034 RepID=UPI003801E058
MSMATGSAGRHRPRAALFDLDGTLVDTNYVHTVTWWQALHQHGHDVPMARIHRAVGMGGDRILDHLLGPEHDHRRDDALRDAHHALYATWFDALPVLDGAADLLRALAARGLRVVLASSASADEVAAIRAALDADDVVAAATSAADVDATKPAPDLVVRALELAGTEPAGAVFVGDTVWDVRAAARADVTCVGLLTGGVSRAELAAAGPVTVYEGPGALLRGLDASPLAGREPAADPAATS